MGPQLMGAAVSTFEERVRGHFEKLAAPGFSPYPKKERPMSKRPAPPAGHSPLPPGDRNFQASDYRNRKYKGDYLVYKDRAGAQMAPLGVPQKDRKSKVDFSKGGGRQMATGPSGQSKRPAPKPDPINSRAKAGAFLHTRNPPMENTSARGARPSASALASFSKQNRARRALAKPAPAVNRGKQLMGHKAGKTTAFRSAVQTPKQAVDAKYGKQLSGRQSSQYFPRGSFGNTPEGDKLNWAVALNTRPGVYADAYFSDDKYKNTASKTSRKDRVRAEIAANLPRRIAKR